MDLYVRLYSDSFHDKYHSNVRNLVCYDSRDKVEFMDGSTETLIFCSFTDEHGKVMQYENCIDIEVL